MTKIVLKIIKNSTVDLKKYTICTKNYKISYFYKMLTIWKKVHIIEYREKPRWGNSFKEKEFYEFCNKC